MHKEESIDHRIRATWQAISKMYNEEAAKHGTTMAMAFVILNIDFEKGTPSTSLGPLMGMEATSLSRILKNMEDKGLIYREKNPNDGRGVLIKLTKFGEEKREFAKESVLLFNEAVKSRVSDEQLRHFFEVIFVINDLIAQNKIFTKDKMKNVS